MKNFIICSLLIIMLSCGNNKKYAKVQVTNPIITIDSAFFGNDVFGDFNIVNIGENIFIIDSIKTDCHCLITPGFKNRIQRGDSTKVHVQFNYSHYVIFQKNIFVFCNVVNSPLLLTLQGEIY